MVSYKDYGGVDRYEEAQLDGWTEEEHDCVVGKTSMRIRL